MDNATWKFIIEVGGIFAMLIGAFDSRAQKIRNPDKTDGARLAIRLL